MDENETPTHWINNELLPPERRIEYYEQELELARDFAKQEERKRIIKVLSDSGIGYYIGEGIFQITGGEDGPKKIIL